MKRSEAEKYINEQYGAEAEYPWENEPEYSVFRHAGNRKWFAILMKIPKEKLDSEKSGAAQIMNVKCDPIMIGSFRKEKGFYPAYHMNKEHWLTIDLSEAEEEKIKWCIDISYGLTAPKAKKRKEKKEKV